VFVRGYDELGGPGGLVYRKDGFLLAKYADSKEKHPIRVRLQIQI
jgi:hypothetical protein